MCAGHYTSQWSWQQVVSSLQVAGRPVYQAGPLKMWAPHIFSRKDVKVQSTRSIPYIQLQEALDLPYRHDRRLKRWQS